MRLEDTGEKALLEMARDICEKGPSVRVGVGDDAAVYEMEDEFLVISTDMLVEDVHFTRGLGAEYLGKKAVVVNLSDLAAMGSQPLGLVFSLGAPSSEEVDFVSDLLESLNSTAKSYESYIVGGDMNESEKIVVSGTSFGSAGEDEVLLRSGAKPGHLIGITGELGAAAAAVEALKDEEIILSDWKGLEKPFMNPVARTREGRTLSKSGAVSSCIDVTDGLVSDAWRLSRMSGVGLEIERGKIPVNESVKKFADETGKDLDRFSLYGGEDFELLFTVEPDYWQELRDGFADLETEVSKIGRVTSNKGVYITENGEKRELSDQGFEHFKHRG